MTTRVRAHQINFNGEPLKARLEELEVFQSPVELFTDLPATAKDGEQRLVKSENVMYRFVQASATWVSLSVTAEQAALWNDKYSKSETDAKLAAVESGSSTISQDLANEVSTRQSEDTRIEGRVDQEITDRTAAVSGVQSNLDTYKTSNDARSSAIESEVAAARGLSINLDARLDGIDADVLEVQGNVDAEETRAIAEEARIEGKVNQEITDRQAAVTGVQNDLNTYKTSNDTRVGNIEADVTAEETARANADTNLQNQINTMNSGKANLAGNTAQDFAVNDLTVSGNILPTTNSLQDIGSPTMRFKGLYVDEAYLSTNTLYIGDTPVMGTNADTITIKADPDQSLHMSTTGVGLTQITSVNGVEMSTSGMNGDIKVQATGTGSRVVMSATNSVELSATNINLTGALDVKGATALDALTVRGNLTVQGTTTTVNSTSLSVKDNIIEVNQGEVGSGVTLGQAGLKVDRGDAADYFMVFDESDDMFKVGMAGQLETIASRPYVDQKTATVQTSVDNYKTSNDARVTSIESVNTDQGNRITSVEGEISTARGTALNLDARLDGIDTAVAGKLGSTANAVSASKLATARSIALAGDVTGSVSFDGSANVSITTVVTDDSHNHSISTVTGLQTALDGKAASVHTHAIADVTGLQTALDGKSAVGHGHAIADVSGLQTALDGKSATTHTHGNVVAGGASGFMTGADKTKLDGIATNANNYSHPTGDGNLHVPATGTTNNTRVLKAGATAGSVAWGQVAYSELSGVPATFAPSAHTHAIADVTGLQAALDGKLDSTATAAAATKLATARTIALGGDVTGSVSFDGSANVTITATIADDSHNHIIANVDGLQTALDGKLGLTGGNLTGNLTFNTTDATGISWTRNSDGASIKFYNTADTDTNSRLEFEVNDNGNEFFRWVGVSGGVTTESMKLMPNGTLTVAGTVTAPTFSGSLSGNASTASTLATARTIALSGDVTGSASFNGGANVTITATVADDSHNHVISNVDGLQAALDAKQNAITVGLTAPATPVANMLWVDTN